MYAKSSSDVSVDGIDSACVFVHKVVEVSTVKSGDYADLLLK